MKNRKILNVLLTILPAVAVVLTALPNSVMMRFAAPDLEPAYIEYCSGFSLLPVGYGNWGPMLAGIISCVLVVLALIRCFHSAEKLDNWIFGLAVAAAIFSLVSVIFGSMTVISWLIAALLVFETFLAYKVRQ